MKDQFTKPMHCIKCNKDLYGCAIYESCTVNYCANEDCDRFGLYSFSYAEMESLSKDIYKLK